MKTMRTLMIAASVLLMAGVPAMAAEPKAKPVAAAPEIASPPTGMGQVVFYRPSSMGALISCRVSSNGQVVNRLPPGRYFVHQVPAGVYDYSVKAETTDVLKVNVEEGETSYVRCAINMGIMTGRPNLSTQTREDFDKRGKKLKLQAAWEPKDDDKNEKTATAEKTAAKN
jgi:hypothetical protein